MSEPCDCIQKIDAELKPKGLMLNATFPSFGRPSMPVIGLLRTDTCKPETRRGKPRSFLPTFCPFCGVRYPFKAEKVTA